MKSFLLLGLTLLLGACAPAARPTPPERPIVFAAEYDQLFDATLQELTASYLSRPGQRRITFAIDQAERDTGLIRAVRTTATTTQAHFRGTRRREVRPGLTVRWHIRTPARTQEIQEIISVVVRPEAEGRASMIYSSTRRGEASWVADEFMERVLERLEARFDRLEPGVD